MWQFGGTDVPCCDLSLTNTVGLGNFGFTQPFFGQTLLNPIFGQSFVNPTFGQSFVNPIGFTPYGTPQLGFSPLVQPLNFIKTDTLPFFGLKDFTQPMFWGQPYGLDKFNLMKLDTLGINPWFMGGQIGFHPTEELWRRTLPFTTSIYPHTLPFTSTVGLFGTPYGITNYTPFGFTTIDEKLKFNSPISTGLFGFHTTPFQTPIDWKMKTFGTPMGVGTDTWTKAVRTSIPWTTQVPGPVSVL
jgi:hypothetical protein